MTPSLDEDLVQRVNDLGAVQWTGTTYRHTAARRDPLSGAGAKMFGGRWNPADSFNAIYLAEPAAACMAELDRLAESQNVDLDGFIRAKRTVHTIGVRNLPVLDLREDGARTRVGLELSDITDDDWTACQSVGHAAYFLTFGGVLAPSASGIGLVLTAFESRISPDQLVVESSEPLTRSLYDALRTV